MGAVGATDFFQDRAAFDHDLGDAERAADLDQLAAGNDDLLTLGESIQSQENRCGIIIHNGSGFRSRQLDQELLNGFFTPAAFAGRQVVFQVDGMAGHCGHRVDGCLRQQRAAQIGMENRAGGVDHANVAGSALGGDPILDLHQDRFFAQFVRGALSLSQGGAPCVDDIAADLRNVVAVISRQKHLAAAMPEKAIHRRQFAQKFACLFRHEKCQVCICRSQIQLLNRPRPSTHSTTAVDLSCLVG